jgi:predicted N-formylglutamate amidohydrolase
MASNNPHLEHGESPPSSLLTGNDPPPLQIINPAGASSFLIVCDHAGNLVPEKLQMLGLTPADLQRHIGWDLGAAELSEMLSEALDATLIRQTYSRLVIDCNRDPAASDAMAAVSDGTTVPGNQILSDEDRAARVREIHEPYHSAIRETIATSSEPKTVIAIHSFTPIMKDIVRPWEIGVLYHLGNTAFARSVLAELQQTVDGPVGDNEPYAMDGIDYTVPRHAYPDRLPYVEIEVRQDIASTPEGRARISTLLQTVLQKCRP